MLAGEARRSSTRAHPQLLIDRVEMGVYCAGAQEEFLGDLGVGEASGCQLEYLDLPGGEPGRILRGRCLLLPTGLLRWCSGPSCRRGEVVGQPLRDGRAEDRLSAGRCPYRQERLFPLGILEDVASRSGLPGTWVNRTLGRAIMLASARRRRHQVSEAGTATGPWRARRRW